MKRHIVAVAPAPELQNRAAFFGLLRALYPVDFVGWDPVSQPKCDGLIVLGGDQKERETALARGVDLLQVMSRENPALPARKAEVEFSKSLFLDKSFRGQAMADECLPGLSGLSVQASDEIVCSVAGQPFWLIRTNGQKPVSTIALGPPDISEGQTVYDHYNRRRWLQILPFFHFLKQLTRGETWDPVPVRACLMFDDPNLHWWTYGHIDFRHLARHAQDYNYHVSLAMVPLDSWFIHRGVASFVRANPARLSLCMHGNDHAGAEFGVDRGLDDLRRHLAQALKRIHSFERRSDVPVAKILVPPHGAFRASVAAPMLSLGYEGVCVSRASLTSWNKEQKWNSRFGHSIAEFVDNLPVIPRQVMAPGHEGSFRLAAFLGQPIIPHGHHQDCADALNLLAQTASSINGLGDVKWMDMTSISRSNFLTRREQDVLRVRLFSRQARLDVPEGVRALVVERAWLTEQSQNEQLICAAEKQRCFSGHCGLQSPEIPVHPKGGTLELIAPPLETMDPQGVLQPGLSLASVVRRLLAETRDRVTPLYRPAG